jgi:ribosomal protein L31
MLTNYVYLLREREFIKSNEEIYKTGMTTKPNHTRFNQYPKGSVLMFQIMCNDCSITEKNIISIFKTKFNHRKDIGSEYFEGDYTEMIAVMYSVVSTDWKPDIIEPEKIQPNYKCDICNRKFIAKQKYNRHINNPNIHTKYQENVKTYICNCGNVYLHNSSLSNHKTRCSRKYSDVSTNWKHDIIEPAKIQQKCDICNKGFNSKQNYNLHINNPNIHIKPRKNIDEYIFNCSCGKKYLHQSSLSKHKKLCSRK